MRFFARFPYSFKVVATLYHSSCGQARWQWEQHRSLPLVIGSPLNVMNRRRIVDAKRYIMTLQEISRNKAFNGYIVKYEHESKEVGCKMKFNVFLPENSEHGKVPGLYFLAGLTCTEDNFMQKSGALEKAAKHGIALIAPDTSPRKDQYLLSNPTLIYIPFSII
jgi:hypothetical protein